MSRPFNCARQAAAKRGIRAYTAIASTSPQRGQLHRARQSLRVFPRSGALSRPACDCEATVTSLDVVHNRNIHSRKRTSRPSRVLGWQGHAVLWRCLGPAPALCSSATCVLLSSDQSRCPSRCRRWPAARPCKATRRSRRRALRGQHGTNSRARPVSRAPGSALTKNFGTVVVTPVWETNTLVAAKQLADWHGAVLAQDASNVSVQRRAWRQHRNTPVDA